VGALGRIMKAKAYVGLDNRFVMTDKFPDDEDHAGLHEMLDEWIDYDIYLANEPLKQGLYELEFEIEQTRDFSPDGDMSDAYLVLKNYKRAI
jgi:hypothetical protein